MDTINIQPKENEVTSGIAVSSSATAYTLKEAETILRRSEKTVSRLIARGKLRRDETFWKIRIPRKDVDNFIERNSDYAFAA